MFAALAVRRCLSHGGGRCIRDGNPEKNTNGYAMTWDLLIPNVGKTNGGSW